MRQRIQFTITATPLAAESVDEVRYRSNPHSTLYALDREETELIEALNWVDWNQQEAIWKATIVRAQAVLALREKGQTVREIAETLGLSASDVGRIAKAGHAVYTVHIPARDMAYRPFGIQWTSLADIWSQTTKAAMNRVKIAKHPRDRNDALE